MTFYALKIQCASCGGVFLVGGDRRNDVAKWRDYDVACPHCQATTRPSNARTIDLTSLARSGGSYPHVGA